MPKLSDERREALCEKTRDVILEMRRQALQRGASPLRLWDQIQDRIRAGARTCGSVPEWATKLGRDLQLPAPTVRLSNSISLLVAEVADVGDAAWLDLMEREYGYVMALARLEAERRKAERDEGPKVPPPVKLTDERVREIMDAAGVELED